jgi:glycosyltransferase involved in cell wall biosynthesis
MATFPVCSVVIRAFNEEKYIERLINGILQQTINSVEIILVDSGSTDGTLEIVSRYPVKVVHIRPEDFTFGRSLNMGISHASAEFVVMASAHVYPVYPDWLESLLKPFEEPKVALTYGKQRGYEGSKFSEHQIFAQWFPDSHFPEQTHPFCNNANAAIRKALWIETPYDETLPGLEDVDWANRMILQGKTVQYVPEAEIIHIHNESPRGIGNRYLREAMAFKRIFPQERFGLSDLFRLIWVNIMHDFRIAREQRVISRVWREIVWFRVMQFWGTYRGYQQSGPLTWQLRQRFYYPGNSGVSSKKPKREVQPIQYNE